jgi:hypothetical protein
VSGHAAAGWPGMRQGRYSGRSVQCRAGKIRPGGYLAANWLFRMGIHLLCGAAWGAPWLATYSEQVSRRRGKSSVQMHMNPALSFRHARSTTMSKDDPCRVCEVIG